MNSFGTWLWSLILNISVSLQLAQLSEACMWASHGFPACLQRTALPKSKRAVCVKAGLSQSLQVKCEHKTQVKHQWLKCMRNARLWYKLGAYSVHFSFPPGLLAWPQIARPVWTGRTGPLDSLECLTSIWIQHTSAHSIIISAPALARTTDKVNNTNNHSPQLLPYGRHT